MTSQSTTPLLGFLPPSAHQGEEVHVRPAGAGSAAEVLPRMSADGSQTTNYGATLGFLNLSVACSFFARPTIFRWVALMGFALQGFVPLA